MKLSLKKYRIHIGITLLLSVIFVGNTSASNLVKVATIGARAPVFSKDKGIQGVVDKMMVYWENQIKQVLPDQPDLIVLPELCDFPTGITRAEWSEYLSVRKDQVQDHFAAIAAANNCYIVFGTMRPAEEGKFWNSAVLLDRKGNVAGVYDKNFPTIGEVEDGVKASNKTPVFQCDFGRIAMTICFDLNFEEARALYEIEKPDIIIFPSMYHGAYVQQDWAYRCRSFFVGSISGDATPSEIRNPLGEVIASSSNYYNFIVATINLDSRLVHLGYNFGKLSALKRKYGDAVTISDPGGLGAVLLSYEGKDKGQNIDQIIKEFDIENLDDYFQRSRDVRLTAVDK